MRKHRGRLAACSSLVCLAVTCVPGPSRTDPQAAVAAVDRSIDWLARNRPDPERAPFGERGLDLMSWDLLSRLHPDAQVRERAAIETGSRLRSLIPAPDTSISSISWWSTLMRIADRQGFDIAVWREQLSQLELQRILDESNPTTSFYTAELLRHSGIAVEPAVEKTMIATAAAAGIERYEPSVADAYRVYHEIAPACDLGSVEPAAFSREQLLFVKRALPALLRVTREAGDTDGAAEVLITASLLGEHAKPFFGEGIGWLISRQRDDGTYEHERDKDNRLSASESRHGVLVASWAILAALGDPG